MTTPNLFREATHELSHSAFLSWLFRSAQCEASGLRFDCAKQLFKLATISAVTEPFSISRVDRERALPNTGRIDLLVQVEVGESTTLWGIETKLRSGKNKEQLKRYKKGLKRKADIDGNDEALLSLYSTRHIVRGPQADIVIRRQDILSILQPLLESGTGDDRGAWLLEEYCDWLTAEQQLYDTWSQPNKWSEFVAGSEYIMNSQIAEIVHYHFFVHTIGTGSLERLHWGTNRGGQPWIQFKITRPYSEDTVSESVAQTSGTLFYRMDLRSRNGQAYPYLEIRQYTERPKEEWLEQKKCIGETIRKLMTEAVSRVLDECGVPAMDTFVEDPPYSSASYRETAICGFHFHDDRQPTLARLAEVFPSIHERFTNLLRKRSEKSDSVGDRLTFFVDRLA